MPSINNLPTEMVIGVTDHLDDVRDIAALTLTSKKFYSACNSILYRKGNQIPDFEALPLGWGAWKNRIGTVEKALANGADPNHRFTTVQPFPRLPKRSTELPAPNASAGIDAHVGGSGSEDVVHEDDDSDVDRDDDDDDDDGDDDDDFLSSVSAGSDNSLDGPYPFGRGPLAYNALHIAAYRNAAEIVETLLNHGADINMPAEHYLCMCEGQPEANLQTWIIKKEQERTMQGLRYIQRRHPIETPIHIAICRSQLAAANVLIERGADLVSKNRHRDVDGSSAIFLAARSGYTELLRAMFESNKNYRTELLDVQDICSLTPLYHACTSQWWHSTVPFLLQHGASLDVKTTVIDGDFEVRATLLEEACYTGEFLQALRLLELGAGVTRGVTASSDRRRNSSLEPF